MNCEPDSRRGGQKFKRFDIWCNGCGKLGHIARHCKRGQGDNSNPGPKSKRLRQADQQGKAGRD